MLGKLNLKPGLIRQYAFTRSLNKLAILHEKEGIVLFKVSKAKSEQDDEDEKQEEDGTACFTRLASWARKEVHAVQWYGEWGTLLLALAGDHLIILDSSLYVYRLTYIRREMGKDRLWDGQMIKVPEFAQFIEFSEFSGVPERKSSNALIPLELTNTKEILMVGLDGHSGGTLPTPGEPVTESGLVSMRLRKVAEKPRA